MLRGFITLALVAGVVSAVQLAAAPHGSPARADVSTGTAGLFVPTQGSVLDTRTGIGGVSGPMAANTWYPVQVAGQAGVPATGVSSVQVSITVLTPTATGLVKLAPDGTTDVHIAALTYTGGGGSISASSIVALAVNGKIGVLAQTSVTLLVHVQGYYTAGNGTPAPGGYVPVSPARLVDTRTGTGLPQAKLATGSTTAITVGGLANVPADASAVFVMLTAISTSSTAGYFSPYPTGTTRPGNVSLNYLANTSTILGAAVDLGTGGQFNLWVGPAGTAIDVIVDVVGYYTATASTGGVFTPASARVYDSRNAPDTAVPAHGSRLIQIGGEAGVPTADRVTAYAISTQIVHSGSSAGSLDLSPGDQQSAAVPTVYFSAGSNVRSDLMIVPPAEDGTVLIVNSLLDPIHVILDVEGWFGTPAPAVPTVTSSSFINGESNALPDANATFSFSAPPGVGNTVAVSFRYVLDDGGPAIVTGSSATVALAVTTDGPHYLLVSALDANGGESDFVDFAFEIGDTTPATVPTADNDVQVAVTHDVTTTEADGASSSESFSTATAAPAQLPGAGGGGIARLSCRVGVHREIMAGTVVDWRYQCAIHRANFGIHLAPPPPGATRVSSVFESGFEWYRDGKRETHTAWHDYPIDTHFHGTFNPVRDGSHVYGTDHFHYSYLLGNRLIMDQITITTEFIAVP